MRINLRELKSRLLVGALGFVGVLAGPGGACAATYNYNATIDPSTLVQSSGPFLSGYFILKQVSMPISPVTLQAGDVVNIDITITGGIVVPRAYFVTTAWDALINALSPTTNELPGPDYAIYSSTLTGYVGPPGYKFFENPQSYLNNYNDYVITNNGPYFGGVVDNGFSVSGIHSQYLIVTGDPNPMTELNFGWAIGTVPEPAAWATMLLGLAGVGGAVRRRRRTVTT